MTTPLAETFLNLTNISKVQIYNKTKDISLLYVKASDQRNKIGLTSSFLENIKGINIDCAGNVALYSVACLRIRRTSSNKYQLRHF